MRLLSVATKILVKAHRNVCVFHSHFSSGRPGLVVIPVCTSEYLSQLGTYLRILDYKKISFSTINAHNTFWNRGSQ